MLTFWREKVFPDCNGNSLYFSPCLLKPSCSGQIWLCRGWFATSGCVSEHKSFPPLCLCLEKILQTANSLANSFHVTCLAGEHRQHGSCIPGRKEGQEEQGTVASVALCVTRTKFKVSLREEKNEAQQKTEKDPPTFCTMSFCLASFSTFSGFQCLGVSWRMCRDLVE